jgi:hypothetical protein
MLDCDQWLKLFLANTTAARVADAQKITLAGLFKSALARQRVPSGQAAALGHAPYFRPCLTSFFSVEVLGTPRTDNP